MRFFTFSSLFRLSFAQVSDSVYGALGWVGTSLADVVRAHKTIHAGLTAARSRHAVTFQESSVSREETKTRHEPKKKKKVTNKQSKPLLKCGRIYLYAIFLVAKVQNKIQHDAAAVDRFTTIK
jgi:hypothetical protein